MEHWLGVSRPCHCSFHHTERACVSVVFVEMWMSEQAVNGAQMQSEQEHFLHLQQQLQEQQLRQQLQHQQAHHQLQGGPRSDHTSITSSSVT